MRLSKFLTKHHYIHQYSEIPAYHRAVGSATQLLKTHQQFPLEKTPDHKNQPLQTECTRRSYYVRHSKRNCEQKQFGLIMNRSIAVIIIEIPTTNYINKFPMATRRQDSCLNNVILHYLLYYIELQFLNFDRTNSTNYLYYPL